MSRTWPCWNGGPTRGPAQGPARFKSLIVKASHNHHGADRAEQWRHAAAAAVELYGDHPAIAWQDLAAEVATEVRLLKAIQAELAVHAARREGSYRWADHGFGLRAETGEPHTDGQVAQLRGAADLDALGDDPPQCVADAHLRCPDLDSFVAGGPVVLHGDPPPAGRGPCLLFQLRHSPHAQCRLIRANPDLSPLEAP